MFRDLDGKTLSLHFIPLSWKVKQLAEKLGQEKALEIEFYRFIWSGKQLEYGMENLQVSFIGLQELINGDRENIAGL